MRRILPVCMLLALSAATAHGQQLVANRDVQTSGATQPDTSGERLKQLFRTAAELEQAGKLQEAATVHRQIDWERQALLKHLDSLQAEVERIRQIAGPRPAVVVHLKVVEVSLTKLRSLGFDLNKLQGKSAMPPDAVKSSLSGSFSVTDDGGDVAQTIEALMKDHLVKVLAEPTVMTLSPSSPVVDASPYAAMRGT